MGTPRSRLAVVVYGTMAIGALITGYLREHPDIYHHPDPWLALRFPGSTAFSVGAGLGVALAVILATRLLVGRAQWATRLHDQFRAVLGPLTKGEVAVFAITSGIAEELLFRGALQPALGLTASSLLFGAVHVMRPLNAYWPWTLWAVLMGFVFGTIFVATGDLTGVIVSHALINYVNLRFIDTVDPTRPTE